MTSSPPSPPSPPLPPSLSDVKAEADGTAVFGSSAGAFGRPVDILWDFESAPFSLGRERDLERSRAVNDGGRAPHNVEPSRLRFTSRGIRSFCESLGHVRSFTAVCLDARISPLMRRTWREVGVAVEGFNSTKPNGAVVLVVTQIMNLALSLSNARSSFRNEQRSDRTRPCLVVISDDIDLTAPLSSVQHSGIFSDVCLIHSRAAVSSSLVRAASLSFRWEELESKLTVMSDKNLSSISSADMQLDSLSVKNLACSLTNLSGSSPWTSITTPDSSSHSFRTGPTKKMTPPTENTQKLPEVEHHEVNTAPFVFYNECSYVIDETVCPPSVKQYHGPVHVSSVSPMNSALPPGRPSNTLVDTGYLERLSPRQITFLTVFNRVLTYCENERIIPRESVVKKRLLDSKLSADVEFEEFLQVVIDAGAAVIEGEAPQRIIWPQADSDHTNGLKNKARKFPCADFFQPTNRLSSAQMQELTDFLQRFQPSVDRGRFGFAQWLQMNGPTFVQSLAHGIIVELVQLLLNRKVLLFRKGKVSVSPALPHLDYGLMGYVSQLYNGKNEQASSRLDSIWQENQATGASGSHHGDSDEDSTRKTCELSCNVETDHIRDRKRLLRDKLTKTDTWSHIDAPPSSVYKGAVLGTMKSGHSRSSVCAPFHRNSYPHIPRTPHGNIVSKTPTRSCPSHSAVNSRTFYTQEDVSSDKSFDSQSPPSCSTSISTASSQSPSSPVTPNSILTPRTRSPSLSNIYSEPNSASSGGIDRWSFNPVRFSELLNTRPRSASNPPLPVITYE